MTTNFTEKYHDFEIEWIVIPSFELKTREGNIRLNSRHGVELYYKEEKQEYLIGFIEGYEWYHFKKGACKIYILSKDSKEWGEFISESEQILKAAKESAYEILENKKLSGQINSNIYAHANA